MAGTNEKSRFSDASQRPSPETTLSMQRCQACWVQSLLHTHVHVHAHAHGRRVNQSSPFLMHHPPNSTPPQPHLKPFLVPYLSFQFLHNSSRCLVTTRIDSRHPLLFGLLSKAFLLLQWVPVQLYCAALIKLFQLCLNLTCFMPIAITVSFMWHFEIQNFKYQICIPYFSP